MSSRLLFAVLWLVAAPLAVAQSVSLVGLVLDAETDEPLAGVTVLVPGTTLGTATDRDGRFQLFADAAADRLTLSFVGYRSQTVAATPGEDLVVRLESSLVDLQPVVVSASRGEEARTAAPVAIAALSAADLEATKPNALHEALNRVPGVYMADLGNEQHAMSIRQPISYRALFVYLEDGIPIRPVGLFNHNALIEVNMDGVDRVEVVRGPSSSLYGSNAVGGAVNFITLRPTLTPEAHAAVGATPDGYSRADASASATLGKLGLWASGYGARQRDGVRAHSDFDKLSLTARADYVFSPRTRLVTTLTTGHLDTDTDGALDSLNFFGQHSGGALTSLQTFTYRKVDATRLASRLSHVWDDRHATDVALFARDNRVGQLPHYRIRRDPNDTATARGEVNEDAFRSVGVTAQHQTQVRVARSSDGGRTFAPSVVVAEGTCPCCRTNLALGPDGSVYVAWRHVFDADIRDIALARSTDGGQTFAEPVRVHTDGWHIEGCPHVGPVVAVDDSGRVHVVWYTGAEDRAGVYHAASTDSGRTFGSARRLSEEVPIAQVSAKSNGAGVWVAWEEPVAAQLRVAHIATGRGTPAIQALLPEQDAPSLTLTNERWLLATQDPAGLALHTGTAHPSR